MELPASTMWLVAHDRFRPLLVTNEMLLDSMLLCPRCRKTGRRQSLTCSSKCERELRLRLDEMGKQLARSGIRFGSLWANEQGTHIALIPNVRSPRAFVLSAVKAGVEDLTEEMKCHVVGQSSRTAAAEALLNRLAVQGVVTRVEKDFFMPLMPVFRAFLRDAELQLSEVELLMPNPKNFLPELELFQKRIRKIAAKAFHPDKHKGAVAFVHYLTSEFWNALFKPTEIGLDGRMRGHETLMAYPGLDLSEPSPIAWRYSKFVGWTPPDETALRRIVAEWRQRATNN